jgi:hypothetical protein
MTTISHTTPIRTLDGGSTGGDLPTPQPLPTHGSGTTGGTTGTTPVSSDTNWVLGTDYTDQHDARAKHSAAWKGWVAAGVGVGGGIAGWGAGYGVAKLRGVQMADTYGYMTDAAAGHVMVGCLAGIAVGAAAGWFIGRAINEHAHPFTATYPERTLEHAYTDDRLPLVLPSELKVADVHGSDKAGGAGGTVQLFTAGAAKKVGSDREAAIAEARKRVLDPNPQYHYDDYQHKHQAIAVLQTVGGQYYIAPVQTDEGADMAKRFDTYGVRATDPALVALVTQQATYRA